MPVASGLAPPSADTQDGSKEFAHLEKEDVSAAGDDEDSEPRQQGRRDKGKSVAGRSPEYIRPKPSKGSVAKGTVALDTLDDDVTPEDKDYRIPKEVAEPKPDDWNDAGICAEFVSPNYSLNQMLMDINGSTGYSEDKAALGTVTTDLFLQITPGLHVPRNFIIGANPFISDGTEITSEEYQRRVITFIYANYKKLMGGNMGLTADHAMFLTLLRLNVVLAGGLARSLESRAIYVDEYTTSDVTFRDVKFDEIIITQTQNQFVADYWLQIVAVLRHVFVTRGHHYKDEYSEFIARTWSATTISNPEGVTLPSWKHLLRTGLHCFGIRFMNLLCVDAYENGKLAESHKTRFNAAVAGTAAIRTGWATIQSMKQAHWWPYFEAMMSSQILALDEANTRLVSLGVRAHVNAKLFNFGWTSIRVDDTPIKPLAPYCLAYIDSLDRSESLKGQRALNKRGDGGSAIRAAFASVLQNDAQNALLMRNAKSYFDRVARKRIEPKQEPGVAHVVEVGDGEEAS
jgi:hypothetical protein